jgi:hypothetical protein
VDDGVEDGNDTVGEGVRVAGWLVVAGTDWVVASGPWDPRPLVVVEHPVEAMMITGTARITTMRTARLPLALPAVRMPTPDA